MPPGPLSNGKAEKMQKTLIIIKPDAFDRRLVGKIVSRFEAKGLQLLAMKLAAISEETAKKHYAEHEAKPFFDGLVRFITGGPVVLMVWGGGSAIAAARRLMGRTNAAEAEPGTIRGDWGLSGQFNLVHGSDSPESAEREIDLFFSPEELVELPHSDSKWFESPS